MLRRWMRLLTSEGRAARRYWRRMDKARARRAPLVQRIRDCAHENRRPNPEATAVLEHNPEVCLDCGTGIVTFRRRP